MAEFYDSVQIVRKLERRFSSGEIFRDYLENGNLFPLEIKLKRLSQRLLQENFSTVRQEMTALVKMPWEVLYQSYTFKTMGVQELPKMLVVEDRAQFLEIIGQETAFERFAELSKQFVEKYPQLRDLLLQKPNIILEHAKVWSELFSVCDFFMAHPRPDCYLRELSIEGVDTKFIERHRTILDTLLMALLPEDDYDADITRLADYGFERKFGLRYPLAQVHFRILDPKLYICGLEELTLNRETFATLELACEMVFIVENKMSMLSFPAYKSAIVIFGSGYKVGVLQDAQWLKNRKVYYWGDIDIDGMAILSQLRGYFPHTKGLLMSQELLERYKHLCVKDSKNSTKSKRMLEHLSVKEQQLYDYLCSVKEGVRLEQERIPFNDVVSHLPLMMR